MNAFNNSLILIGMPGAGKSTLGVQLAKILAKDFIDTDQLLEAQQNISLQTILEIQGYKKLRALEEELLLHTRFSHQVIATGGSAVYSAKSMAHLKHIGPMIFLDVAQPELERRIHNMDQRGIARAPDQSFTDIYNERRPLYLQHAEIVVDCNDKTKMEIIDEIIYQEGHGYTEKDA